MTEPGTYRIAGPLCDYYWERSSGNGEIIANNFITNAPGEVRVSVRPMRVHVQGCAIRGNWALVG